MIAIQFFLGFLKKLNIESTLRVANAAEGCYIRRAGFRVETHLER